MNLATPVPVAQEIVILLLLLLLLLRLDVGSDEHISYKPIQI
jgi:hypothetical protein